MCARRTATIGNGVVEEDDTALMDFLDDLRVIVTGDGDGKDDRVCA
jgi:hypothetical protein